LDIADDLDDLRRRLARLFVGGELGGDQFVAELAVAFLLLGDGLLLPGRLGDRRGLAVLPAEMLNRPPDADAGEQHPGNRGLHQLTVAPQPGEYL